MYLSIFLQFLHGIVFVYFLLTPLPPAHAVLLSTHSRNLSW